jgi:hypothetical protein
MDQKVASPQSRSAPAALFSADRRSKAKTIAKKAIDAIAGPSSRAFRRRGPRQNG